MCVCVTERRNKGGQVLFIEFCDWAIKQKQLSSGQDDGCTDAAARGVSGGGAAARGAAPSGTGSGELAKGKGRGSGVHATSDFR